MPIDDSLAPRRPQVAPSAPLELVWLGHQLLHHGQFGVDHFASLGPDRTAELADRLDRFWGDGVSGGTAEFAILADLAGQLFVEDPRPLVGNLPATEAEIGDRALRSEDPSDRRRMVERVARLRRDPGLRASYAAIIGELWEAVRPDWESRGLPQVGAAAARLSERLDRGADLDSVPVVSELKRKKAEWRQLIEEASAHGRLTLVPCYFGGLWSLWDFPNHAVVGFSASSDPLEELREAGRSLAPRLRALSDPTRLHILLFLGDHPTSVGELADTFGLAQPTVSAHLRVLREAAMVQGERSDGRTIYRADREQLGRLLREVAERSKADLG